MTERVILACGCYGQAKKAAEAFCLLFPNEILPDIIRGRDRIYKLGKALGSPHIIAISRLTGRFMYYVRLEGDKIIEEVDLQKGTRIK